MRQTETPAYGKEKDGNEGMLYTFDENSNVVEEKIPSETGDYKLLFDQVFKAIRGNSEYFINHNDILGSWLF
ncbi:hypothetical protein [Pedobacter alpinus]|uniref:Uncharacterized protein n=1 Tax=Pedobacter alpinus TaxID=1590643 RepID=A0ABW5TRM5_9SPHI